MALPVSFVDLFPLEAAGYYSKNVMIVAPRLGPHAEKHLAHTWEMRAGSEHLGYGLRRLKLYLVAADDLS